MIKSTVKVRNQWLIQLGGFCGIVSSVLTVVMVYAATVISPWFRWNTNALSDLGVGEASTLFNSAVFLGGVFNFFFAIGMREWLIGRRLVKVGIALIMLGSVSLVLVGVFTVAYPILHGIVALGHFILTPIGSILIGLGAERNAIKEPSIVAGTAALLAILVLPMTLLVLPFKIGFAVPEIIEALIVAAWIIFIGAKLLKYEHQQAREN